MTVREEVIHLVEELPESDLLTVKRMLQGLRPPEEPPRVAAPMAPEERRARAYALAGKYAHTHTSVDAFLASKREDVELEEERYRRRHGGAE